MEYVKKSLVMSQKFLESLKEKLHKWFNLGFRDLPGIIKLLGIQEDYYDLVEKEDGKNFITFFVQTAKRTYIVRVGNGEAPYRGFQLLNSLGDTQEMFNIQRLSR